LFDGITQQTGLPETAEDVLKFREGRDGYRSIDRSPQGAPDECSARGDEARNGLIGAAFFLDLYP
jgi:hypothetical protein